MVHPELKPLEGKYEILEKMAEGGMGAVYKVHHRLLEETRVIKVIRPQLGDSEETRQRFLREARSAVKLRHPNIALLHDFTVDGDGTSYMVMEYIDGLNLVDLVRQSGRPSVGLVLDIGIQTLRALGYLHKKYFVHRDVSPDNVMLTRDVEGRPLVKLIDLGIAKPIESDQSLTSQGLFLGKVRYASPEQFGGTTGEATVEPRSDLYSLGIVLYVLLTGRYPIQGKDHAALMAGHLFHPPVSFEVSDPDGLVPEPLRAVVLRALAKDPDDRFASAAEFSAALATIRRSWQETEPPPGPDVPTATVITPIPLTPMPGSAPAPGTTQDKLDHYFVGRTDHPETTAPPSDPRETVAEPSLPPLPGTVASAARPVPVPTPATTTTATTAPRAVAPGPPAPEMPAAVAATPRAGGPGRGIVIAIAAVALVLVLGTLVYVARIVGRVAETPRLETSGPETPGPETVVEASAMDPAISGTGRGTEVEDEAREGFAANPAGASPELHSDSEAIGAKPGVSVAEPGAPASEAASGSAPAPPRAEPRATAAREAPRQASEPPRAAAAGRDRDLDALAAELRAGSGDATARAKQLMETARSELFEARSAAQTASAARLVPAAFAYAKSVQRDAESRELAGDWVGAARGFRDGAALFANAATEARTARAGGRSAAQQASAATGDERAVLEAIELYAQAQRRQSASSTPAGPSYASGAMPSLEARGGTGAAMRVEGCSVQILGFRATAECHVRGGSLGGGPVRFELEKSGNRWLVQRETPI